MPERRLLEVGKKRKLSYIGHMNRAEKVPAFICQGYVDEKRARGRPRRRWVDDVKEWTGMTMADCVRSARNREQWRRTTTTMTLHTQGLPTHGMMAACLRDILIYSLLHIALPVSHPNTIHHSRLET